MIRFEGLCVDIAAQSVLRCVRGEIPRNKITVLIGPNGSGKSTLLKTLLGLLPRQCGDISIDGLYLEHLKPKQRARTMAYVPQQLINVPALTVEQYVALGRAPYAAVFRRLSSHDRQAIKQAMAWMQLEAHAQQLMTSLSGGQRQRAMLAMALAQDTPYLLLDEPLSYLDLAHQLRFIERLKYIQQQSGKGVLLVLHDLHLLEQLADQVIVMRPRQQCLQGSVEDMLANDVLQSVFAVKKMNCCNHGVQFTLSATA